MFKIGDKVVLADKRLMWDDGSVYKEIETIEVNNIAGREVMTYKVVGKNIYYNENILELYIGEDTKEKALEKVLEKLEYAKEEIKELKETEKKTNEELKRINKWNQTLREENLKYSRILDAISTIIEI